MVNDVQKNDRPICDSVEATVVGRQVKAIQIRDPILLSEVAGNGSLLHDVTPLSVQSQAGDARLKTLPNGLGWLPTLVREGFPRGIGILYSLVDYDLSGTERHPPPSEAFSLCQCVQEAGTCRMGPLNAFRAFDCEPDVKAELQGTIQAGATRRVARLFESIQQPVPTYRIARPLRGATSPLR